MDRLTKIIRYGFGPFPQGHRRLGYAETFPQHGPYGDHFLQLAIKYRLGKLTYEFHCNFVAAYKF